MFLKNLEKIKKGVTKQLLTKKKPKRIKTKRVIHKIIIQAPRQTQPKKVSILDQENIFFKNGRK